MNTNRRTAIKYFVLVTAGMAFLPSCKNDTKKVTAFNNITIDEEQQNTLAEISETILPATDTPGAKDVSAHIFALQMLNDCYVQAGRERFIKGFQQFEDEVQKQYGNSFIKCTKEEKEAIVASNNIRKDAKSDALFFYKTIKQLTIQAYTGSKYFLTKVQVYKLVPGKYISSVPV